MSKYILSTLEKPLLEEEDDSAGVEETENDIYFYSQVNKKSILDLNKKIQSINLELSNISRKLNYSEFNPEIKLKINSGGGSLLDCFAAVDYIRNSKYPIHSIIEGTAASAATIMSVIAKKRSINKHSFMLIHQLSGGMWGKFESMKDEMENCNVFMNVINEIYGKYTKIPKNVLKEILKRDIYMDAKTCLKYGLVDNILE